MLVFKVGAQTPTLNIADSLYVVGNNEEAIKELEMLSPKSDAALLKLARSYKAIGNWEKALSSYETVLHKNPSRVLTAIDYGEVLIKMGELKAADSLFANLATRYPQNAGFEYQLGLIKEKEQDSTYLDHFRRTIKIDKYHQQALYKLAKYELSRREFTLSEELALQGLEKDPENASLLSILAQTYFNERSYIVAITPFEKLLELNQGSEFVHTKLGYCYYQAHWVEEAIGQYKVALTYEDRNSDTHYNLGKLYARTGDLEKSEMHLLMALLIKKQPVDNEYLSLALTYKLKEDYKKSLEYFDAALEENPDNERALYERAVAADNYFKDMQSVLKYYQAYLNKYEKEGEEHLVYLAQIRMKDIRKDLHLAGE
ncbi:tetratricopeptide repeat protein [Gillisia sp. M10.2A]|uniref:Tetratricopeptide repeat protein n=1 Tax=Gillisia lutea TaxID=2909668 RepID=A0ABS9EBF8_9FLAO|nr:tetratricopeptide repeat protein [Gillisia lutea]MCF4100225.1 tetratricopeptide repeat protein [Gillisia lutea]